MIVVNQGKDMLVETSGLIVMVDGLVVSALTLAGKNIALGVYESEKRAKDEFERLSIAIKAKRDNAYYMSER